MTYYTIPKAAEACGVNHRTVRRWISENKIQVERVGPINKVYIAESELDKMVLGGSVKNLKNIVVVD